MPRFPQEETKIIEFKPRGRRFAEQHDFNCGLAQNRQ